MPATSVIFDFETASDCNLKLCGAWRYAEDPTTQVLSLRWGVISQNGPWAAWRADRDTSDCPPGLAGLLADPNAIFIAHSANFERAIWRCIMVPDFGWPGIPDSRWHDTQAAAAMLGLPLDLDKLTIALRIQAGKDKEGNRITLQASKPGKDGFYKPIEYDRIVDYNGHDIDSQAAIHRRLGWLPARERRVWLLDQKINERGLLLDMDYVRAAQHVVDGAIGPLNAEFRTLTGVNPGQRDKVLAWVNERVETPFENLTKETLDERLGSEDDEDDSLAGEEADAGGVDALPEDVQRALRIRRLVGSSAIKKLARMEACVSSDGRARGLLQYHGAGPGRWAGRLLQPQNFPRGTLKADQTALVEAILTGDHNHVAAEYGSPIDAVVTGLRHAIVAAPGKLLVAGDFSQIEARIVLALAGQHDKLALMATKATPAMIAAGSGDIYCDMATSIYRFPVIKGDDPASTEQRQTGKNACFAADTLVLTRRGYIPIVDVLTDDQLWDGIEWVKHEGVAEQGGQIVRSIAGIWATPDHPVWLGEQWRPWESLAREPSMLGRALAIASANLPSPGMYTASAEESVRISRNAPVAGRTKWFTRGIFEPAAVRGVRGALRKNPAIGVSVSMVMRILFPTKPIAYGFSTAYPPVSDAVSGRAIPPIGIMAGEASASGPRGLRTSVNFSGISLAWTAGISQIWSWTGRMLIAGMNRAIFDLSPKAPTSKTNDRLIPSSAECWSWKPAYDLVNVGPRRRFTVLSNEGPLIVHNCLGLGFQMGWKKFRKRYAKTQPEEFAQNVVDTYRKVWAPNVPAVWREIEDAALGAVRTRRPHEARGVLYQIEREWLTAELPSGRKLWYFDPREVNKEMPWSTAEKPDWRKAWTYKARKNGRFITVDAFGGLLTENVVQGLARDLMVAAMFRCEAAGMPIVLTIHDQIVAEVEEAQADILMLDKLMVELPEWARRLQIPVQTECWAGRRFRK